MDEDMKMHEPIIVGGGGGDMGAGLGAGLGGGLLGGILGGALLGNNGLLGNRGAAVGNVEGIVTPSLLAASLAQVTDTANSVTVLQTLGDIKASVPLAEAQVQLALAGNQAAITSGQALINKNISDSIAAALASQTSIKESVAAYGMANLTATKDAQYATVTAIKDDGEKTRALITANAISDLQRQLTVAESVGLENRLAARGRETEINITNTNTAVAQQMQAQAQSQAQSQAIIQLAGLVQNLSGDIQAVRQGQVVFNSGTMAGSATQAAANTKVA